MKKIYILLLLTTISVTTSKSQEMNTTAEGLGRFLTSTLYVPITGNTAFDEALQNGFSKYWKITPYKLLEFKEFSKLEKANEKQKNTETPPPFLFTWSSDMFLINNICQASTSWQVGEMLLESHWLEDGTADFAKSKRFDYVRYRIEYIVKAMNDIITFTRDNKLDKGNPKQVYTLMQQQFLNNINTKAKNIKDKTLVLNKDASCGFQSTYNPKIFSKYYPYPHKFVSDAEFKEILKGEQKEYVCFFTTYTGINVGGPSERVIVDEMVYEPSTRSRIYMNTRKVTRIKGMKEEDIEQLKKAITQ